MVADGLNRFLRCLEAIDYTLSAIEQLSSLGIIGLVCHRDHEIPNAKFPSCRLGYAGNCLLVG